MNKETWDKEFDRHFLGTDDFEHSKKEQEDGTYTIYAYAIKNYIRQNFISREELKEEIEKMKKEEIPFDYNNETRQFERRDGIGYNRALENVISLISKQ